jgi:hypothetical protein
MCGRDDEGAARDPREDRRRMMARDRQRRRRARQRETLALVVSTVHPTPRRPDGWAPEPPEPWWGRDEALPLRRAWFGRGLRLPMTGPQTRLLARWARRGSAYVALCAGIVAAPRRGGTYAVVAAGLAKALDVLSLVRVGPRSQAPQGRTDPAPAASPPEPGAPMGWDAMRAIALRLGWT